MPASQQLLFLLLLSGREILHNAEAAVKSLGHENARYNAAKWCPLRIQLPSRLMCCSCCSVPEDGLHPDSEVCSQDCGHSRVKMTCLLIREISHLDILGGLGDPLLNGTFLFSSQRCVVLVNILDAAADASATLQVQL